MTGIDRVTGRPATVYTPPEDVVDVLADRDAVPEYAEAMCQVAHFDGWMVPVAIPGNLDPRYRVAACFQCQKAARACVAVEERRTAALVAEVERLNDENGSMGERLDGAESDARYWHAEYDALMRASEGDEQTAEEWVEAAWPAAALRGPEPTEAVPHICPECAQGKHGNCNGEAWDVELDQATTCTCPAHGDGA